MKQLGVLKVTCSAQDAIPSKVTTQYCGSSCLTKCTTQQFTLVYNSMVQCSVLTIIIWLAQRVGKMNQTLCCDWLSSRQDGAILVSTNLAAPGYYINLLLTILAVSTCIYVQPTSHGYVVLQKHSVLMYSCSLQVFDNFL